LYKLRSKAISRRWDPLGILETWHVDDAPRSERPKISTALALFIIQTITKNSTTRGWPTWRIAAEASNTPSVTARTECYSAKDEGSSVDCAYRGY